MEKTEQTPTVTEDTLLSCDLCILSYQLYHQSLIWPLDPWYETLARGGTERRSAFMTELHERLGGVRDSLLRGPACLGQLGESNTTLDPIITHYSMIDPHEPAFSGDGGVFIAMQAPDYVTAPIGIVGVCDHSAIDIVQIREVKRTDRGQDHLIAFEGGTGAQMQGDEFAWSLMGFVLKRTRDDGTWDAHIVFRGSRSGWPNREVLKSPHNPDWVTDLASTIVIDNRVGGEVAIGFALALRACWPGIVHSLKELDGLYGAPKSVQVTGHSLGAALAALCVSTLTRGSSGRSLHKDLGDWPFTDTVGCFMALPPVGSEKFCRQFNLHDRGRSLAPFVVDDPVVECSKSVPWYKGSAMGFAGYLKGTGGYSPARLLRFARPRNSKSGENSHELYLIRIQIVESLGQAQSRNTKYCATPWAAYVSFADMLGGVAMSTGGGAPATIIIYENVKRVIERYRFSSYYGYHLDLVSAVVSLRGSYRGIHKRSTLDLAAERVKIALASGDPYEAGSAEQALDLAATQVAALLGLKVTSRPQMTKKGLALEADDLLGQNFAARIGLGIVLTLLERDDISVNQLVRIPEIRLCLEVQLHNVENWQKGATQQHGWVSDSEANRCLGCARKFKLTRRRHHCRQCGEVFCDACSRYRVQRRGVLSSDTDMRVCRPCFDYIRSSGVRARRRDARSQKAPLKGRERSDAPRRSSASIQLPGQSRGESRPRARSKPTRRSSISSSAGFDELVKRNAVSTRSRSASDPTRHVSRPKPIITVRALPCSQFDLPDGDNACNGISCVLAWKFLQYGLEPEHLVRCICYGITCWKKWQYETGGMFADTQSMLTTVPHVGMRIRVCNGGSFYGQMDQALGPPAATNMRLSLALQEYVHHSRALVMTTGGYSVMIGKIRVGQEWVLVDSHRRSPLTGRPDLTGNGVIIICQDLTSLVEQVKLMFGDDSRYDLDFVELGPTE